MFRFEPFTPICGRPYYGLKPCRLQLSAPNILQEARAADRVDLAIALMEAVTIPAMFEASTAQLGGIHRRVVFSRSWAPKVTNIATYRSSHLLSTRACVVWI